MKSWFSSTKKLGDIAAASVEAIAAVLSPATVAMTVAVALTIGRTGLRGASVTVFSTLRGVLFTSQFPLHRLATGDKRLPGLPLEFIQIVPQQAPVQFDLHLTTGPQRAIVGETDLLGESNL